MTWARTLSKSKLLAFRQCPKQLWLEMHQSESWQDDKVTLHTFATGHEVGTIAQRLYDPSGIGEVIDYRSLGTTAAAHRTQELIKERKPIFEAGFMAEGALAFADVLLPDTRDGSPGWRMVEVKSATSVKEYYKDDVAIQGYVAKASGLALHRVSVAHIDKTWVYPGGNDYNGLLVEADLSEQTFARQEEVRQWIADAQVVVALPHAPDIQMGSHCHAPYTCGFAAHCAGVESLPQFPVTWLPRIQSHALKAYIERHRVRDMLDVPDSLLNNLQRRVRDATVTGSPFFDVSGAAQALRPYPLPACFLDFETINFAVPRWKGIRPYQTLPFQFSLHQLASDGRLTHEAFLDVTGNEPSASFARVLTKTCPEHIPIFVYNAGFEGSRLKELAQRLPHFGEALLSIKDRLVDLLPIAQRCYYHPDQRGSWSIKNVVSAMAPHMCYASLAEVQDGGLAMQAYAEAIDPLTDMQRKAEIERQLFDYCAMDTLAMVEMWKFFAAYPQ